MYLGGEQDVAKLTSLHQMRLGSSQHTQQKTMEGHLEKCDRKHVIATFVIIY